MPRLTTLFALCLLLAAAGNAVAMTEVWGLPHTGENLVRCGPVAYAARAGEAPTQIALCQGNKLVVKNADGKDAWSVEVPDAQPTLAVADVDRDGRNEILAAAEGGDAVVCVRAGGKIAWRATALGSITGGVACADVLGDRRLEVIASTGEGGLFCLDAAGKPQWQVVVEGAKRPVGADPWVSRLNWNYERYENRDAVAPPTVGDVDGDGAAEIIYVNEPGYLYCVSGRGEWRWQRRMPAACNGTPVIADLAGDGRAQIIVGCDDKRLYLLDGATGRVQGSALLTWGAAPATAVADLDGDGRREIVCSDNNGILFCLDAAGKERWRLALKTGRLTSETNDRLLAPPAIADVDGDGEPEIVVGMRSRELLYLITPAGKIKDTFTLETGEPKLTADSGVWDTPVVADLDRDGRLEIVAATKLVAMHCVRADQAGAGPVLWAGARGTMGLTGCVVGTVQRRSPSPQPSPLGRGGAPGVGKVSISVDEPSLVRGALPTTIIRPATVPAVLLTTIRTKAGYPVLTIDQVLEPQEQLGLAVPVEGNWPQGIEATLVSVNGGQVLARSTVGVPLGEQDACRRVREQAVAAADAAVKQLELTWARGSDLLAARVAACGSWRDDAPSALETARRELQAAEGITAAAGLAIGSPSPQPSPSGRGGEGAGSATGPVAVWTPDPWAMFQAGRAAPPAGAGRQVSLTMYRNEYEAGAVNVLNLAALSLPVQVAMSDLAAADGTKIPAGQVVLRQTAMVPRYTGEMVGDALPLLDATAVLQVPPAQAAQLWLTVNATDVPAGTYTGQVTLTALALHGPVVQVPVSVTVLPLALPKPEESPVRFCTWAYFDSYPVGKYVGKAIADLVAHKNSVWCAVAGFPAKFDAAGRTTVDWSKLDAELSRFPQHGIILLQGWAGVEYAGEGKPTPEMERGAFAEKMRLLARHMAERGIPYERWAIYITDEPGLDHGPRIRYVLDWGPQIKAADPRIQVYTDPVQAMGLDDLQAVSPIIDIWCPEQDSIYRLWGELPDMHSAERMAIFHGDSKEVWTYECFPRVKGFSPLGYYRHQGWFTWQHGMNGMGFWTYGTDPASPWLPGNDEYVLVYPGADGPIPSKRWEACRDGVEDHEALLLAAQAADRAAAAGKPNASALRAEIDALAREVVQQRCTLPVVQRARARLAEITLALQ